MTMVAAVAVRAVAGMITGVAAMTAATAERLAADQAVADRAVAAAAEVAAAEVTERRDAWARDARARDALDRLTAEGYVRRVSEEIVNGRARRSYGLTDSGAGALRAEAARMEQAAAVVTSRLLRRGAALGQGAGGGAGGRGRGVAGRECPA